MPKRHIIIHEHHVPRVRHHAVRPGVEGLEARILLYSDLGDQWTYSSRITYSFMPDGTSVGGVPSALFQTLNANYPTATWQQQIEGAAALWENVTNANLALVSDGGQAVGIAGNQQDDPRFGDIRIGAVPLPPGVLAETFLPPPDNGGTDAGDILLNSSINWQINSNYDLQTVVAHEFGHALGLGESSVSTAVMYGTYNGIKHSLTSDDISGIDSIYGTRQFDSFNTGGHRDNSVLTATNISSYITGSAQIAIPGLDITTTGDTEWFYVKVPSTTTGTMTVTAQSSNLSSLSPMLQVYNSSLGLVGQSTAPAPFGATVSVTASVSAGQGYYFKVLAASGPGPIGGYGLLVNFGNQSQSPIPPPNTVVPGQPDQGGGTTDNAQIAGGPSAASISSNSVSMSGSPTLASIGDLTGWVEAMSVSAVVIPTSPVSSTSTQSVDSSDVSVDQGSSSDGTAIPLPTSAAVNLGLSTGAVPAQSNSAILSVAASLVAQAVDDALDQWSGDDDD